MTTKPKIRIKIAPRLRGFFAPRDLINAVATMLLDLAPQTIEDVERIVFGLWAPGYELVLGTVAGQIAFRRNDDQLLLPLSTGRQRWFVIWGPEELRLHVQPVALSGDDIRKSLRTEPTLPPNTLIEWARREAIVPRERYGTALELQGAVVEAMLALDDKLGSVGMESSFWDTTYAGARIKSRRPKREPHVHPGIHGLLWDMAIAKNLEIAPEVPLGAGQLDFLVSGSLESGGRAHVCVEFKHAHSPDLEHGLLEQLPDYMRSRGTDLGIYAVCWFRGRDWDRPAAYDSSGDLQMRLDLLRLRAGLKDIRILILDMSRKDPPSMRRAT